MAESQYYTMPGFKKTQHLYNYDQAKQFPFVSICEGVSDVWRFGSEAVALFGKNASSTQLDLIARHWQKV